MRRDKPRSVSTAIIVRSVLTTASVAGVLTMAGLTTQAHEIETTPGVTVDTSVLDQMGQPQTVPDLLFPGLHAPRSRLLVPPVDASPAPVLQRPAPDAVPHSRLRAPSMPQRTIRPTPPPIAPATPAPPAAEPMPTPQPPTAVAPAPQTPTVQPQAPEMPAATAPATPSVAPPAAPQAPIAPQVAPSVANGDGVTLTFAAGETTLPSAARPQLEGIAKRLSGDEALQVRVMSYAGDAGNDASRARRTSLSRALAVRSFLMDQGVRSTRIEVRALGQPDNGPADRVDLTLLRP